VISHSEAGCKMFQQKEPFRNWVLGLMGTLGLGHVGSRERPQEWGNWGTLIVLLSWGRVDGPCIVALVHVCFLDNITSIGGRSPV
jgi:hypothetical protein